MSAGQCIEWHDLFAVVDDGTITAAQYDKIEAAMRAQAKAFPAGIACLVILPAGAKPPPEAIKRRVKDLLTHLESSLTCLAYAIEGTGFKAVAARAALVGMKVFTTRPYPIYVETSLESTLAKVLPHLKKGSATGDVRTAMKAIANARGRSAA